MAWVTTRSCSVTAGAKSDGWLQHGPGQIGDFISKVRWTTASPKSAWWQIGQCQMDSMGLVRWMSAWARSDGWQLGPDQMDDSMGNVRWMPDRARSDGWLHGSDQVDNGMGQFSIFSIVLYTFYKEPILTSPTPPPSTTGAVSGLGGLSVANSGFALQNFWASLFRSTHHGKLEMQQYANAQQKN